MRTTKKPSRVFFNCTGNNAPLENSSTLRSFLSGICTEEKKDLKIITYQFGTDTQILALNQQYLKHDYYTDILTFDLSESEVIEADIFISLDRVRANAGELKISFETELLRVMIHGILHLCGYDDSTARTKQLMRAKEDHYLNQYTMFHG